MVEQATLKDIGLEEDNTQATLKDIGLEEDNTQATLKDIGLEDISKPKEDVPDPMKAELDSLDQADKDDAADDPYARFRRPSDPFIQDVKVAISDRKSKDVPEFQKIREDDLDTRSEWLDNAKTIYKYETGKDFNPDEEGKSLSNWFKGRHSALNNNITNIGLTALDVSNMSDDVKKSLDKIYDNLCSN